MKKRILLVDTSALMHSAKYSLGKRLTHNKIKTGIIYGFLLKLQLIISRTQPNIIVFALDSRKSLRLKIYPEYKEQRHKNKTEQDLKLDAAIYKQFDIVTKHVIPKLGYRNNFKVRGLEADDIIASICKTHKHDEIIIASNDGDLYQLLTNRVSMFLTRNNVFFTKTDFIKRYKIKPKTWKYIKAIGGCTSDSVKGITGVGETRAILYCKGELPNHYKSYQAITSKSGKRIIKRNKRLVWLPFKGTPEFTLKPNRVSKRNIEKIAKEFNMQSILGALDSWYFKLKGNQ